MAPAEILAPTQSLTPHEIRNNLALSEEPAPTQTVTPPEVNARATIQLEDMDIGTMRDLLDQDIPEVDG